MKILTNLFLLISTLIASTGVAMSQNPQKTSIAIACTISDAENAPDFAAGLCDQILNVAIQRWPDSEVVTYIDGASFDLVVGVDISIVDSYSAGYQLSWANQTDWSADVVQRGDKLIFRLNDANLDAEHSVRFSARIFKGFSIEP